MLSAREQINEEGDEDSPWILLSPGSDTATSTYPPVKQNLFHDWSIPPRNPRLCDSSSVSRVRLI
jgi:hypothetical protein